MKELERQVLVVAAHPDDEVLGCGGTMAWHEARGDKVHVIFMADGVGARTASKIQTAGLEKRNQAMTKAMAILNVASVKSLNFPDNRMDELALLDIVQALELEVKKINPEIIYTHFYGDLNIDHRLTHQAVMTACRPTADSALRKIYSFEVLSSTEWASPSMGKAFQPNAYIDISAHYAKKQMALQAYAEELREFPHPRSLIALEALHKLRGASIGAECAEAFVVERLIER